MSLSLPPPPEAPQRSTPFWKRWWFWAIVVVVLILIAAGIGVSETTQTEAEAGSPSPAMSATQPPVPSPVETALVPEVDGKSVDDATAELEAAGLDVSIQTKLTDQAQKGTVVFTAPMPGSSVEVGDTVTLTVAEPLPKIPHVVGKTVANAKRALKNAGFEVGRVTQQTSGKRKGTVISQSPDAGTSARPGRAVSLVVAKPAPQQPTGDCQGYSPCIPPGPDVDCLGGTGDGPRFVSGPVRVTGSDPYGLDGDGNGVGCE
jgi:resuscitation-promoting factor RpfB